VTPEVVKEVETAPKKVTPGTGTGISA